MCKTLRLQNKILLFLFLVISLKTTFGQTNDSTEIKKDNSYKYWMTLGVLFIHYQTLDGGFNASYAFSIEENFYKVGYLAQGGFKFNGDMHPGKDGYLYNSIIASIGKRDLREWSQASAFLGLAYIWGEKEVNDERKNYWTVGLQADVQILFKFAKEFGIGVGGYGNLNFEKSYWGVNINLTIGNGK